MPSPKPETMAERRLTKAAEYADEWLQDLRWALTTPEEVAALYRRLDRLKELMSEAGRYAAEAEGVDWREEGG